MNVRTYDIDDPNIPYEKAHEPTLEVGMLVTLKRIAENHSANVPFWMNKNHAIVKSVGWSVCDWDEGEGGATLDSGGWFVVPFAELVWDDGEETNTAQNAVIILSEAK